MGTCAIVASATAVTGRPVVRRQIATAGFKVYMVQGLGFWVYTFFFFPLFGG